MAEKAGVNIALGCKRLSKAFDGRSVLRQVNFSVDRGKVLAVMGRSGSGKSTLLRLLSLLERADDGDVWLGGEQYLRRGEPLLSPVAVRRRIAIVFQHYNLFPHLTVTENCVLGPERALGTSKDMARRDAIEVLTLLGLGAMADRYPETLSGGEAQRVALARAILMKPEVLLLDEVTAALDPESIFTVIRTIRDLRTVAETRDLSIIMVTHLLSFAQSFADEIAFLDSGQLVDARPAGTFAAEAQSPAARSFIEQAESNWVGR